MATLFIYIALFWALRQIVRSAISIVIFAIKWAAVILIMLAALAMVN